MSYSVQSSSPTKTKISCPKCGCDNHEWNHIHIERNAKLEKLKQLSIAWCDKTKEHVLHEETSQIKSVVDLLLDVMYNN